MLGRLWLLYAVYETAIHISTIAKPFPKAIIAVTVTGLKLISVMQRSQWVAILTGAITVILGVGYLILVQLLDWRGEMLPAPTDLSWLADWVLAFNRHSSLFS